MKELTMIYMEFFNAVPVAVSVGQLMQVHVDQWCMNDNITAAIFMLVAVSVSVIFADIVCGCHGVDLDYAELVAVLKEVLYVSLSDTAFQNKFIQRVEASVNTFLSYDPSDYVQVTVEIFLIHGLYLSVPYSCGSLIRKSHVFAGLA